MNDETIKTIVSEIAPVLVGRKMGKVFQLSRLNIAIDFRSKDGRYLFLGVDPQTGPRLYLIARRVRELEKQSVPVGSFVMTLHKRLADSTLLALEKDESDRVVRFSFAQKDVTGQVQAHTLVAQLTGRAANLILLDDGGYIIDSIRPLRNKDSDGSVKYEPPTSGRGRLSTEQSIEQGLFNSISEAADAFYLGLETERTFASRASLARARLKREINRRVKLRQHLQNDLDAHGDADTHKRIGELLIANVGTADRQGDSVTVTDYYAEGMPRVELPIDKNLTLQEEAGRRFTRYSKARRAADEIANRLVEIEEELLDLHSRQDDLEVIVTERDSNSLENFFSDDKKVPSQARGKKRASANIPGARRYLSSDGFEILVGRGAKDNDHLTFRVARPYDLWLHAANYPGSHVIILNPTRKEIPHRTIIEAAQLAAKFSHARLEGKVDVHYTQRKFIAKPKGSAPGLVRMSSFRTIIVEPRDSVERL